MRSISDTDLVKLIQDGVPGAFDELVRRYRNKMFRGALSIVQRNQDAEEVAADVFVLVWKHIKNFRGDCKLSTWMYLICRRKAINRMIRCIKHDKRSVSMELSIGDQDMMICDIIPDSAPLPYDNAISGEDEFCVFDQLNNISHSQKEIIIMRQKGMSYKDIAESRGILIGTVKSQLSRARDVLREKVKNSS